MPKPSGANSGSRTHKVLPPTDFKSAAYSSFAILAFFGADNGTRTRNAALEGLNVTITPYPHFVSGRSRQRHSHC